MRFDFLQAFSRFWETSPAFLLAIPLALGTLFALETLWALIFFCFFLFVIDAKQIFFSTLLFISPLMWMRVPDQKVEGPGIFYVEAITYSKNRFHTPYCYRGHWSFCNKTKGRRLPTRLFLKTKIEGNAFSAHGVMEKRKGYFHLKCSELKEIPTSCSLTNIRYRAKQTVQQYIKRHIKQKDAADFISGIFTGEIENKLLISNFSKLGLSHLLAISGLHFALIALFFKRILFFLPHKVATFLLLMILTCYFLFVGNTPSVQRAWIFISVTLLGQLLEKRSYPINNLGVALLIATLISPFSLKTLSFQLTFLATAGILIYFPLLIGKKPAIQEILQLSLLRQHLFLFWMWVKNSLILTLAVHLFILPLLIWRFHIFYPHTLIYNLFFPQAASLSLILFLLGVMIPPLHTLNTFYTASLLQLVEDPPLLLPGIYFEEVSFSLTALLLLIIFIFGIQNRYKRAAMVFRS